MIALVLACAGERPVTLPDDTAPPADETVPEVLSSEPCDACGGDCLVEALAYDSSAHVTDPIDYADVPPAGGPHDPCWATWGVHTEPVPDDNWVHNVEHGGVVFLYRDTVPSAVADLGTLAAEEGIWVLVTPYPEMSSPFAAVAYGFRMTTGCVDSTAFGAFYDAHVDRAPESIPSDPGEACP